MMVHGPRWGTLLGTLETDAKCACRAHVANQTLITSLLHKYASGRLKEISTDDRMDRATSIPTVAQLAKNVIRAEHVTRLHRPA